MGRAGVLSFHALASFVLLVSAQSAAQSAECENRTLQSYFDDANVAAVAAALGVEESAVRIESLEEAIEAQPSAPAAAPQGFASRVNESLADFMPLLQFAVTSVSTADDEESVTVKFNPLAVGRNGAIAASATITEPKPFASLVEAIPEAVRADQEDAITDRLGDFDDITWSATYGYQRPDDALKGDSDKVSWSTEAYLWGRNPKLYGELLGVLLDEVWQGAVPEGSEELEIALADLEMEIACALDESCEATFSEVTDCQLVAAPGGALLLGRLVALSIRAAAEIEGPTSLALHQAKISDLVALIDNQPQATATVSYRDVDERVGQKTLSVNLSVEIGTRNLNTLLRRYRSMVAKAAADLEPSPTHLDAWHAFRKDGLDNKNRFTFSASFLRRENYSFNHEFEVASEPQDDGTRLSTLQSVPLELPRRDELAASVLYSRSIGGPKIEVEGAIVTPRLDLSAEFVDVDDDPMRQDRLIARLGYTIPLGSGVSVPISLTYANHSEFVGEQDERLSAHLGLSYSLDRGAGGN